MAKPEFKEGQWLRTKLRDGKYYFVLFHSEIDEDGFRGSANVDPVLGYSTLLAEKTAFLYCDEDTGLLRWEVVSPEFLANRNKQIYISGKVSEMEEEAVLIFAEAEKKLKAKGYSTLNPMSLPHQHDKSWHRYMKEDVKSLCDCDAIYMLSNWTDSKGAIIEHTIALHLGIKVYYEQAPEGI